MLLRRIGVIVGVACVLLAIRTLVAPPAVIVGRTKEDLKAYLCNTDWWDHSFTTYGCARRNLYKSLFCTIHVMDDIAERFYSNHHDWRRANLGHDFSVTQLPCSEHGEGGNMVNVFKTWLKAHEEAQVMLASILVVVGLWWLVRTVLTLLINLVCPLLVVLLAVVCVPQLRAPLLGQNYPMLANLIRNILIKLAENIKA